MLWSCEKWIYPILMSVGLLLPIFLLGQIDTLWVRGFEGYFYDVVETEDAFIGVGFRNDYPNRRVYIVKVDRDGNLLWERETCQESCVCSHSSLSLYLRAKICLIS